MEDFITEEGAAYRVTEGGRYYCGSRRISRAQFEQARIQHMADIQERASDAAESIEPGMHDEDAEQPQEHEEEAVYMASKGNVIMVDGHEYVHDFFNKRYYRDGERIPRARFMRAMRAGSDDADAQEEQHGAPKQRRRSKDAAFEFEGVTLTSKQADFLRHIDDSQYCSMLSTHGVWLDFLQDEIGGQFAGRPMTVGAMVSTLREKGLLEVHHETREECGGRIRRVRVLMFTDLGRRLYSALTGRE